MGLFWLDHLEYLIEDLVDLFELVDVLHILLEVFINVVLDGVLDEEVEVLLGQGAVRWVYCLDLLEELQEKKKRVFE